MPVRFVPRYRNRSEKSKKKCEESLLERLEVLVGRQGGVQDGVLHVPAEEGLRLLVPFPSPDLKEYQGTVAASQPASG